MADAAHSATAPGLQLSNTATDMYDSLDSSAAASQLTRPVLLLVEDPELAAMTMLSDVRAQLGGAKAEMLEIEREHRMRGDVLQDFQFDIGVDSAAARGRYGSSSDSDSDDDDDDDDDNDDNNNNISGMEGEKEGDGMGSEPCLSHRNHRQSALDLLGVSVGEPEGEGEGGEEMGGATNINVNVCYDPNTNTNTSDCDSGDDDDSSHDSRHVHIIREIPKVTRTKSNQSTPISTSNTRASHTHAQTAATAAGTHSSHGSHRPPLPPSSTARLGNKTGAVGIGAGSGRGGSLLTQRKTSKAKAPVMATAAGGSAAMKKRTSTASQGTLAGKSPARNVRGVKPASTKVTQVTQAKGTGKGKINIRTPVGKSQGDRQVQAGAKKSKKSVTGHVRDTGDAGNIGYKDELHKPTYHFTHPVTGGHYQVDTKLSKDRELQVR